VVFLTFIELDGVLRCNGFATVPVHSDREIVRGFDEDYLDSLEPCWRDGLWVRFVLSPDGILQCTDDNL